jgi:hypothetical protein
MERLAECIAQPFEFEQKKIPLDASVGLAIYPEDGRDSFICWIRRIRRCMTQTSQAERTAAMTG